MFVCFVASYGLMPYGCVCVCFVFECCVHVFVGCVCEFMRDVVWFVFSVLLMCVADKCVCVFRL